VPGIIYKKYAAARAYGVEGVMQCWYFGNYPSMMSKAAGELAFVEKYEDEDAFLTSLAAIYWGRSRASQVVLAWKLFEKSYRMYPMNIMFSYYGPMHDSVVWKLYLEPKNNKLPRTWQTLDPIDGDRIGESLLQGHTLDEALTLLNGMCEAWAEGLAALTSLSASGEDMTEQISVAKAIGILFSGGRNILAFYKLRDELGTQQRNPWEILKSMETLVYAEIENSRAMIPLCEEDGRLGVLAANRLAHGVPAHSRHHDVEEQEVGATRSVHLQGALAVRRAADGKTAALQGFPQEDPERPLVVRQQNVSRTRHRNSPPTAAVTVLAFMESAMVA